MLSCDMQSALPEMTATSPPARASPPLAPRPAPGTPLRCAVSGWLVMLHQRLNLLVVLQIKALVSLACEPVRSHIIWLISNLTVIVAE